MKTGKRVSGSGAMVTEILEHLTGQRLIFRSLSLLIRTAVPDGQDLLGVINFAMMAVNLLAAGKTGRLTAYRQHENYIDLSMETVTEPGGSINVAEHHDAPRNSVPSPVLCGPREFRGAGHEWAERQRTDYRDQG